MYNYTCPHVSIKFIFKHINQHMLKLIQLIKLIKLNNQVMRGSDRLVPTG